MADRLLISDAFELYKLDFIIFKNQSRRAVEANSTCTLSIVAFLGDVYVDEIKYIDIRKWKLFLDEKRSSATVRNYILSLRVVLRFLRSRGYETIDPETIPIPKREKKAPAFVTSEEVIELIDNCYDARGRAVVSLLYSSGIRLSELLSLNKGDIRKGKFTVTGKGNKPRICFTDDRSERLLNEYLQTRKDNNQALFVSRITKTRMTHTNIQMIVRGAAKRAGLEKHITPHKLRHGFATNFLENNGNMRYLQRLLGHESLDTTAMYAHVVDNDLQAIYAKFHSI